MENASEAQATKSQTGFSDRTSQSPQKKGGGTTGAGWATDGYEKGSVLSFLTSAKNMDGKAIQTSLFLSKH